MVGEENGIVRWHEQDNWGEWTNEQQNPEQPLSAPEPGVDYTTGFAGNAGKEIRAVGSDLGYFTGRGVRNFVLQGLADWANPPAEVKARKVPKEKGPSFGQKAREATGRAARRGANAAMRTIFDFMRRRSSGEVSLGFPDGDVVEGEFKDVTDQ